MQPEPGCKEWAGGSAAKHEVRSTRATPEPVAPKNQGRVNQVNSQHRQTGCLPKTRTYASDCVVWHSPVIASFFPLIWEQADVLSSTFRQVKTPALNFSLHWSTSLLSCLTLVQRSLLLPPVPAPGAIFNDDVWASFSSAVLWGGGHTCDTASMCINSKL